MYESGQRFLLKALHEAGNEIASRFHALSEVELNLREGADGWSLREICCHFRDAEDDFGRQIELIAESERREPRLPAVDVDLLVAERPYAGADASQVLSEYSRRRSRTCYLLSDLWEVDWGKAGIHPYRGRVTISEIAHEMNEHDLEHIWQIKRILDGARAGRR